MGRSGATRSVVKTLIVVVIVAAVICIASSSKLIGAHNNCVEHANTHHVACCTACKAAHGARKFEVLSASTTGFDISLFVFVLLAGVVVVWLILRKTSIFLKDRLNN